ncbi:MAG: PAS domain S-box protein, partial [Gammaproteobacteria bacterium]
MSKYRNHLPQLDNSSLMTDGGLETTLIYQEGVALPQFAALDLLEGAAGTEILRRYSWRYVDIARADGIGIVLEAPSWRASPDWAAKLGYDAAHTGFDRASGRRLSQAPFQEQLKARLEDSEARLARIIDSAMDSIIAVDDAGRILLFNSAAERVFRCRAEEAIGVPCQRFLSQALCRVLTEYMGEAGAKTPIWVPEGHGACRADGETFPVEATFSYAETNGQALYTVFLRDVEERQRLRGLNLYLQEELRGSQAEGDLIGASQGLRAVRENVRQVAATDASVLLLGETGTGKEVIARAIHASSTRKDQALITLNC